MTQPTIAICGSWLGTLAIGLIVLVGCRRDAAPQAVAMPSVADAQNAFQLGDLESAEKIARQLLTTSPNNLDATMVLAEVLAAQEKLEQAAELLILAAPQNPKLSPRILAQAAELHWQHGDVDRSIDLFEKIIVDHPRELDVRRRLAGLLNERGFRFDANEHLRYLAARTTLSPRELTALINPMLTWVDFPQKPRFDDVRLISESGLLNVVAALRANGDVRDALLVIENASETEKAKPSVVAMRGWLLTLNQRFDDARRWAISTNQPCQRYPAFWLAIGNLMAQENDPSASDFFLAALSREPGCEEAILGLIQSRSGLPSKEIESLRQRVRLLDESRSLARAMISSPNQAWELSGEMGRVMNEMGRYAESLAWQETLISSRDPGSPKLATIRKHKQAILQKFPSGLDLNLVTFALDRPDADRIKDRLNAFGKSEPSMANVNATNRPPIHFPHAAEARFVNVAASVGIEHRHQNAATPVMKNFRLYEPLGSGIACCDYDKDGNVDLYLGQAGCDPPNGISQVSNQLYRNLGNRFRRHTSASGCQDHHYTHGVTTGDWNQDGFADLLIANIGVNRLLINQGDGTYVETIPSEEGGNDEWNKPMMSMSMAIADINGDAIPDLFEVNYVDDAKALEPIEYRSDGQPVKLPGPKHFKAAEDRLFLTTADGKLSKAPLGEQIDVASTGLGVLVTDIDGDRNNEVFVANDQNANQLWHRQPDSTWTDQAVLLGCAFGVGGTPYACMGIAAADFDRNGHLDLHVTNFSKEPSNLYMQNKSGIFRDVAVAQQLDRSTLDMVGFGTQAFDYDNNTTTDLAIVNGHIEDFTQKGEQFQMPSQILTLTEDGFSPIEVSGDQYWREDHLGRCLVILDWNNDGRVDLAATDLKDHFALLENRCTQSGNFVQIELVGTESERDAIGTRVTVYADGMAHVQVVQTGDGYLGKNQSCLFFGLGSIDQVDRIEIQWPSGTDETVFAVPTNRKMLLIEGQVNARWIHDGI